MDDLLRALRGPSDELQGTGGHNVLEDLLGGLLGGVLSGSANAEEASGLAEQAGVTPAIAQAAVALLAGRLATSSPAGHAGKGQDVKLGDLLDQVRQGQEVDQVALRATGLPQELSAKTGLDLGDALKILQKLLPWLAKLQIPGLLPLQGKPQNRPTRPSSSGTRPKPSSSSSSSKPRPKPARPTTASSSKPSQKDDAEKPKRPAASSSSRPSSSSGRPDSAKETTKPSASNRRRKPGGGSSRSGPKDSVKNG